MIRNMNKRSKWDPSFGPDRMQVVETDEGGVICKDQHGRTLRRHMDDVKVVTARDSVSTQEMHEQTSRNMFENMQDLHPEQDAHDDAQSSEVDTTHPSSRRYPIRNRKQTDFYS